jgi:hypothetical protein
VLPAWAVNIKIAGGHTHKEKTMKKKHGVFFGFAVLMTAAIFTLTGCSDTGGGDDVWLADLSNPFIGKWQSEIPGANTTLIFDYKTDGTFGYEMFGVPAEQGGKGSGGYLVTGNIMVTFLSFEGMAGYTFKVVDNNTINVTEIAEVKEDGELVLGNTAPFTRVADSSINKENKPFVLSNRLIGKWSASIPNPDDPSHPYETLQEYKRDGTAQFTLLPDYVFPVSYYFVIGDVFVTFDPSDNEMESFVFTFDVNEKLTAQELLGINSDGSRKLGVLAEYNPQQ